MGDILQFPTKRRVPPPEAPENAPDLFITGIEYSRGRVIKNPFPMRSEWFKEVALGYHDPSEIPAPVVRRMIVEWLTSLGIK